MKYNTLMERWQTALRRSFTTVQDPVTLEAVRQYYDNGFVKITFISRTDKAAVVYTNTELDVYERLANITDRSGEEVIDYTYYVQSIVPAINPMGFSDGYAYKVAKVAPEDLI